MRLVLLATLLMGFAISLPASVGAAVFPPYANKPEPCSFESPPGGDHFGYASGPSGYAGCFGPSGGREGNRYLLTDVFPNQCPYHRLISSFTATPQVIKSD